MSRHLDTPLYVCFPRGREMEIAADLGAHESVPIDRFVGRAEGLPGLWLIANADKLWTRLLPVLRDRGYVLTGAPGAIYSARSGRVHVEIRSADPLLARDPVDARDALALVRLARALSGRAELPKSLSQLFADRLDIVPDYRACLAPARPVQRLFTHDARAPDIWIYDQRACYGAAAATYGLPHGPRMAVPLGQRASGRVEMFDATVEDRSRRGLLPRDGHYAPGTYRTIVAAPLLDRLDCTGGPIRVTRIHAVYHWARWDAAPLVRAAWGLRCRAQSADEGSAWKVALQSVLGLLGQRDYTYHYQWGMPAGSLENWSPINLSEELWALRIRRSAPHRHAWAHAYLRQCAMIPLLDHIDSALRVYVDSITTMLPVVTSTDLGGWREVARGQIWRASGPGDCALATQDGEIAWECGIRKKNRIILDGRASTC